MCLQSVIFLLVHFSDLASHGDYVNESWSPPSQDALQWGGVCRDSVSTWRQRQCCGVKAAELAVVGVCHSMAGLDGTEAQCLKEAIESVVASMPGGSPS